MENNLAHTSQPITHSATVRIGEKQYALHQLNSAQRRLVIAKLQEAFLNAAFSGTYHVQASNVAAWAEAFPEAEDTEV